MHSDHSRDLGFLACVGVDDGLALLDFALVDTDPSKLAILCFFQLESETHKGLLIVDDHLGLFTISLLVESVVTDLLRIR